MTAPQVQAPTPPIEDALRQYFVKEVGISPGPGDHDLLLESGFVASAQLLELVDFIEERFQVVLRPIDVLPQNLATIATIAETVRGRLNEQAQEPS